MKKYFVFIVCLLAIHCTSLAQIDVSSFTIEVKQANCLANGCITVKLPPPGAQGYKNTWTAELTVPGTGIQAKTANVPIDGSDINFTNLDARSYSLRLTNGFTSIPHPQTIPITSSYVSMLVSASATAPSCPVAFNQTRDATATINITNGGGLGPFEYRLVSPTLGTLTQQSPNRSYTFTGLVGGETVSYSVRDLGCEAMISGPNFQIPQNTGTGLVLNQNAPYNCIRSSCTNNILYINIDGSSLQGNRLSTIRQPGNATIEINGNSYPLTFVRNDLVFNSGAVTRFEFDPSKVSGAPNLTNGMPLTIRFNWGCGTDAFTYTYRMSSTISSIAATYPYIQCDFRNRITIDASPNYNLYWLNNPAYTIERENPVGTFTSVATGNVPTIIQNNQQALLLTQSTAVDVADPGTYRVTLTDGCNTNTQSITFQNRTTNYPINETPVNPTGGILEGTGGLNVEWWPARLLTFPMTVKVERVDNQNNWTINPTQPLNLAGSYSFSFPFERTYNSWSNTSYFTLYDLPYGQYRVTLTDGCSATNRISRIETVTVFPVSPTYNPQFSYVQNCLTSNISFALNNSSSPSPNSVTLNRRNDNGTITTLSTLSSSNSLRAGIFQNITTGNGKFRINYGGVGVNGGFSVARNVTTPTSYFQDIEIPPYQNIDISINSEFCSPGDPNSGIVGAEVSSGTLNYPLSMELWNASGGVSTTVKVAEQSISSPNKGIVFTNLSPGEYIVRVRSACYTFDKPFTLNFTTTPPQARVSESVVCPGSPATVAIISATNNLYDIDWYDKPTDQYVGSGMPISLTPNSSTIFQARFKLKSTFNCPTSRMYTSDVPVKVTPNPTLGSTMVSDIELCKNTNYAVTISNTQNDFTYEILTPTGQSYSPKVIANGNGGDIVITIPNHVTLTAGNKHKVFVTNGNSTGCRGNLVDEINILRSTPLLNLTATGGFVCPGNNGSITIQNAEDGITYTVLRNGSALSPSLTAVGTGQNLTFTVPSSVLTQASNEFTIRVSGRGCSDGILTQKPIITVQQPPIASTLVPASCGTASGSVTLTTNGGSGTYEYSIDNVNWQSSNTFNNLLPASYTFYSRDPNNNSCRTQGTIQVLNNCFEFTKTVDKPTYSTVGEVLNYTITVRNTGTTTLTNITVTDPIANVNRTIASLAPSFNSPIPASYTITQTDINTGSFTNTATAVGMGTTLTASATSTAVRTPAIKLTKTASTMIFTRSGQQITYTFKVENTGNVPLSNITITDPLTGLSAISPASVSSLAPGAQTEFTATYTTTNSDVFKGTVTNTATASGTFNGQNYTSTSSVTISTNTALPATGLELSARWINNNNDAELSWSTLTEQNTDYFVIERSTDGRNFNVIGNPVKAAGNSNSKRTYLDYDRNLKGISTVFYRLRLFDIDKSSRYSNTAILRSLNSGRFNVYPNPAINLFTIEFNQAGTYDVQLYRDNGQLVRKINDVNIPAGNKVYSIDRGSLPNGTYILRIINKRTNEILNTKILFVQ